MNTLEILKVGLVQGGFDGLYSPGTCGCLKDDLATCCESLPNDCKAGYKHTHSENGEWVIADQKAPLSDDEISMILSDC